MPDGRRQSRCGYARDEMKVTAAAAAIADVQYVIAAVAVAVERRDDFVITAIGMGGVNGVSRPKNADKRPKRDQ